MAYAPQRRLEPQAHEDPPHRRKGPLRNHEPALAGRLRVATGVQSEPAVDPRFGIGRHLHLFHGPHPVIQHIPARLVLSHVDAESGRKATSYTVADVALSPLRVAR